MRNNNKPHKHALLWALYLLVLALLSASCAATPAAQTPAPVHEASIVHTNGIDIAYETFGPTDRETVLLIGGTGQQLIDWPPELIDELVGRGLCIHNGRRANARPTRSRPL